MSRIKKLLIGLGIAIMGLIPVGIASAAPYPPALGGTGTSTLPSNGSVLVGVSSAYYGPLAVGSSGQCLIASSSAPYGVAWGACLNSASAVLSVASSAQIVASASTGSGITFSFASNNISQFTNNSGYLTTAVLSVQSSSDINASAAQGSNVQFSFASHNISQFTNNTGYVTSTITIGTTTASGVFNVTSSGNKAFTITLPSDVGFFTNDAGYVTSSVTNGYLKASNNLSELTNTSTARTNIGLNNTNQNCAGGSYASSLSATTTIGCTTLPAGIATTTINGFQGVNFSLTGIGNVTSSVTNGSTTFSLINSGVASGTYNWANLTISSSGIVVSANANATPVTSLTAGTAISLSGSTGGVTVTNTGVTSFNGATGTVTFSSASGTLNGTGTAYYFPYWVSSSTLSATSSIFISSSTGNVGIGTTNPKQVLDIEGTGNTQMYIGGNPSVSFGYTIGRNTGTGYLDILGTQGSFQGLNVNGGGLFSGQVTSNGQNVINQGVAAIGIGTTTPAADLDIQGGTEDIRIGGGSGIYYSIQRNIETGILNFTGTQNGDTGYNFGTADKSNALVIGTGTSGNVGIGTAAPSSTLHVVSNTTTTAIFAQSGTATTTIIQGTASSTACSTFYTPSGTPIYSTYLATGQIITSTISCQ